MRNVSRKNTWLAKFMGISNRDVWMALAVFAIGFLTAYSARAEIAPPTQAEWEAYGKLKPVKKFNYDKVYNDIDSDLARLTVKEDQYAQNLPLQVTGPMHAISKKQYRGSNARIR